MLSYCATREGDPIAIETGIIITCAHEREEPIFETIAESFDEYFVLYNTRNKNEAKTVYSNNSLCSEIPFIPFNVLETH